MTFFQFQINPQHTIPTLVDNGFALWESRAIMIYLAEKYGKNDSLYPKDPQIRAVINQRLYFDMSVMYIKFSKYFSAKYLRREAETSEQFKDMDSAFELLEIFLEGSEYAACNHPTIADIALTASVSSFELMGVVLSKYPKVHTWYKKCKNGIPGYDANEEGLQVLKNWISPMQ